MYITESYKQDDSFYVHNIAMHQTRRTHNAHNETQRRLAKVARAVGSKKNVKYVVVYCRKDGSVNRIDTPYDLRDCLWYGVRVKSHAEWKDDYSLDNVVRSRKRAFYVKLSKSSGHGSGWASAKKTLHRKWRRMKLGEPSYRYKGSGYLTKFDYF